MSLLETVLSQGFDRSEPIGRDELGRFTKGVRVRCSQCEALVISGVAAHETGCPNVVRYVDCFECGCEVRADVGCDCQSFDEEAE